jgi:predicted Zn-dependent peptidase
MGFHEYDGAGSYFTSFSSDPDRAAENLAIIHQVMEEVQRDGITVEELHQAKSKHLSQIVRAHERPMSRMRSIGMTWSYLNEYRTVDDELKAFDAVTLADVREVLDKYPLTRLTTLALGPLAEVKVNGNGQK